LFSCPDGVQPDPVVGLVCQDPGDVTFVECLLGSGADWLITGGKDLLEMKVEAASRTPQRLCDRYL
jgi:predicted nucleic acid-binding protein